MAVPTTLDATLPRRGWASRRRALIISAVLGLVFVVLASAVFTIAGRSRDVANRSVELHSLNETLRAATVVRAQATFAAYLASTDRTFGTDSRAAIRVSVTEARQNLAVLLAAQRASRSGGVIDSSTREPLLTFRRAAERALAATTGGRPAEARRLVRESVIPSFAALRSVLEAQRDEALADVKQAGSLLGRLGGLASFVITFVLPTIAVLVYRQLTRQSRESAELSVTLARERGRSARLQRLLAGALEELRRDVSTLEQGGSAAGPAVSKLTWDVDALATVVSGARQLSFAEVQLEDELGAVAGSLHDAGVAVDVRTDAGAVWTDATVLATATRLLALEARAAGAQRIRLDAVATADHFDIRVAHDGAPLPPGVASLLFDRSSDDQRAAVEAGAVPVRLLAAQMLLEALGGSLAHNTGPSGPYFLALLPQAAASPPDAGVRQPAVAAVPA